MSNSKKPATGTTFAKGITAASVIDAVNERKNADLKSFDTQWEEARQLGHVHRFAEANKKATGRTIADHLTPIAQATGVALKTLQNRAGEGRKLIDSKGLTKAVRDKLRKQLETEGKRVSVRNVIALHTGGKVEKKTSDKEREEANEGNSIRTEVEAKAPGSKGAAKMDVSDDPQVAALEWLKLGQKAAKACNVDFSKFLQTAGLHQYEVKA